MYRLVIGNHNYSSWSLRAWLYLVESKVSFETTRIALFDTGFSEAIARVSPAGRVPVLLSDGLAVWDSMAIIEHVRRNHAGAVDWPALERLRAWAQSISFEMHSGFLSLRDELPQNIRARRKIDQRRLSDTCQTQIGRIDRIWSECRDRNGGDGDWLFGGFSIADVVFAPVALRFLTYSIDVSELSRRYIDTVRGLDSVKQWTAEAARETETLAFIDDLVPASDSPLVLG